MSSEVYPYFVAIENGSYAVEVTQNSCIDTTTCFSITNVSLSEITCNLSASVYPNPSYGNFFVKLVSIYDQETFKIFNIIGKKIYQGILVDGINEISIKQPAGTYFIKIETSTSNQVIPIIIK